MATSPQRISWPERTRPVTGSFSIRTLESLCKPCFRADIDAVIATIQRAEATSARTRASSSCWMNRSAAIRSASSSRRAAIWLLRSNAALKSMKDDGFLAYEQNKWFFLYAIRTWMCRVQPLSGNLSTVIRISSDFPSRFAGRGTTFTSYQLGLQHYGSIRRKSRSRQPLKPPVGSSRLVLSQSLESLALVGIGNCPARHRICLGDCHR